MKTGEETSMRRGIALSMAAVLLLTSSPLGSRTQTAPSAPAAESPIEIAHDPLACMTPVLAPEVDAGVAPPPDYDRSYVYFRSAGTDDYYYVRMDGPPTTLAGILPRPKPETKAVDYYIRAYDLQQASKKRGDWTPPVVPGTTCKARGVVVGPAGAGLTVGLTREGQTPYPPGFNEKDIAKIILVSGAVVSVAEALQASQSAATSSGSGGGAGAGAGGLSTAAVVAGGVVIAGAAAIAINEANKDDPQRTPTPTVTPTPTIPALRFVQADVSWSGVGNVDLQILNPGGQAVGQTFPGGCESTANRTERVVLQGALPSGTYRVVLTGGSCGTGTPATISAVVSVQSDTGEKCASRFVTVPVPGTVEGCQFNLP